jgi:hypothetical protein
MTKTGASPLLFQSGFGNFAFTIKCTSQKGLDLAALLFLDLPGSPSPTVHREYELLCSDTGQMLSLWDSEKRLYSGESEYQLAYALMNDVLYRCIDADSTHHALHAGAVGKNDLCVLLPGTSGSGKSTLTAWLLTRGFQYLTDELIFLSDTGKITPLTRPLSLKGDGAFLAEFINDLENDRLIKDAEGVFLPHRLLNTDYRPFEKQVSHFIFPKFIAEVPLTLEEISPAKCSLYLMQSHVNARNHSGLGVHALSKIVRNCRSFTLSFGSFDGFEKLFAPDSILFG